MYIPCISVASSLGGEMERSFKTAATVTQLGGTGRLHVNKNPLCNSINFGKSALSTQSTLV